MTEFFLYLKSVSLDARSISLTRQLCHRVVRQRLLANTAHADEVDASCAANAKRSKIPPPPISAFAHRKYRYRGESDISNQSDLPFLVHSAHTRSTIGWPNAFVSYINKQVSMDDEGSAKVCLFPGSIESFNSLLTEALETMRAYSPLGYALVCSLVTDVIAVESGDFMSSSSPFFLGAIALNPEKLKNRYSYVDHLVHEASHIDLFIRQNVITYQLSNDSWLDSPFRQKRRPIIAVLHACFVLARICLVLREVVIFSRDSCNDLQQLLHDNLEMLSHSIESLQGSHELSEAGSGLLANIEEVYLQLKNGAF